MTTYVNFISNNSSGAVRGGDLFIINGLPYLVETNIDNGKRFILRGFSGSPWSYTSFNTLKEMYDDITDKTDIEFSFHPQGTFDIVINIK